MESLRISSIISDYPASTVKLTSMLRCIQSVWPQILGESRRRLPTIVGVRVILLPHSDDHVILPSFVSARYQHVADRRTDNIAIGNTRLALCCHATKTRINPRIEISADLFQKLNTNTVHFHYHYPSSNSSLLRLWFWFDCVFVCACLYDINEIYSGLLTGICILQCLHYASLAQHFSQNVSLYRGSGGWDAI